MLHHVTRLVIDRRRFGGLDALGPAQAMIQAGSGEAFIAGGSESYSQRPVRSSNDHGAAPMIAYYQPHLASIVDQDPNMAEAADLTSDGLKISCAEQDEWFGRGHQAIQPSNFWLEGLTQQKACPIRPNVMTLPRLKRDIPDVVGPVIG